MIATRADVATAPASARHVLGAHAAVDGDDALAAGGPHAEDALAAAGVTVCPHVVVRAALWPAYVLDALASPAAAAAARTAPNPASLPYRAAYAAAISTSRAALHARTVADDRFARALAMTNPELSLLAERLDPAGPRNKRARHLETTLVRTLARAATRTEPCDLWAGVATAVIDDDDVATRGVGALRRVRVAPDLRPFVQIFRAHIARHRRHDGRWRLNPTLTRVDAATPHWHWWLPRGSDGVHQRLRATPTVDALFASLAGAHGRSAELADMPAAHATLTTLADAGALVGGVQFPARFTSAWDALHRAEHLLEGDGRAAWNKSIRHIVKYAIEMMTAAVHGTAADVRACHAATATAVAELARALDVAVSVPRAPLRCDAVLDVTLPRGVVVRTHAALAALAAHGRPAALGAHLARAAATAAAQAPLVWEELCARTGDDPAFRADVAALARALDGERVPATPLTAALPALLLCAPSSLGLAVHGIASEVAPAVARYGDALAPTADWLARELRCRGVADLVAPYDDNPNALARTPSLADLPAIDPWCDAPWSDDDQPLVVAACSANVGASDPRVRALLAKTGRTAVATHVRSDHVLLHRELGGARSPPLVVDGRVVRTARTVVTGAELTRLLAGDAPARFFAWQALAARHGWPTHLAARRDDGPALHMHRDSPLALEALLEGAASATMLVVEEPLDEAWLELDGELHVAELAVAFTREGAAAAPRHLHIISTREPA